MKDNRPLVVTGTGRSGSGYIARVLSTCGVKCGHEAIWGLGGYEPDKRLDADSSWMALCDRRLKVNSSYVIHQTRHPQDTLASMLGGEMFGEGRKNPWFKHRENRMGSFLNGNDVHDAMAIWVTWNSLAEIYADHRWRVEDVGEEEVEFVGDRLNTRVIPERVDYIPTTTNTHAKLEGFKLDDLPRNHWYARLMGMAKQYGYDV